MADMQAVWGIEIGNAGLKAIRLRYAESAGQVIAAAFDYVPHAKLLSQPDASPDELIAEAVNTFLSRNQLGGDTVVIGLPGQTALAKFIQMPPVEGSKVAEIVKYEARQQIPFALEEVIWDWQVMGSGIEEGGYLLDAEVGLFAMKRDQVQHHLQPFLDRKVELELVQIAPLAQFNYLWYDHYGYRLGGDTAAKEEYVVLLDMGADNTSLLVTNGQKIWIRNVPLGGNHFTRALTKEMKLTFAKAEHLKCNATRSPDPRAVFQALRPIFNDYVSEIQRSIGYFASVNRQAKISKLIGVGNGFKLAGLQKFLQQNLQYEVERVDQFPGLVGDNVLTAPLFQDNLMTFTVPYGLALQGLGVVNMKTSLLPPEIALERTIRRKKPWAVAAAASLLVGLSLSAAGYASVLDSVSTARFGEVETAAGNLETKVNGLKSKYSGEESRNKTAREQGGKLVTSLDSRELWLEVYKAINDCLPRDVGRELDLDPSEITLMNRISLKSITAEKLSDLSTWYGDARKVSENAKTYMTKEDQATAPSGAGYVFTLQGVHYHHEDKNVNTGQGSGYVIEHFLKKLQDWKVDVLDANGNKVGETPVGQIGISHATLTKSLPPNYVTFYPQGNRMVQAPGAGGMRPGGAFNPMPPGAFPGAAVPGARFPMPTGIPMPTGLPGQQSGSSAGAVQIPQSNFIVQFAWKPTPPKDRLQFPPGQEPPADGTPATDGALDPAADPTASPAAVPAAIPAAAPAATGDVSQ